MLGYNQDVEPHNDYNTAAPTGGNSSCHCFFVTLRSSGAGTVHTAETYILPAAHLNLFAECFFFFSCLHPTLAVSPSLVEAEMQECNEPG